MTDEERKKLCENLRDRNNVAYQDCEDAALEIERLAKENEELREHLDWLDSVALGKPS
jgi:FtsZ-binding cell division protein ZapB